MTGHKDGRPGSICFDSHDGFLCMFLVLDYHNGLYYCPTNVFTVDHSTTREHSCPTALMSSHLDPDTTDVRYSIPIPKAARISSNRTPPIYCHGLRFKPTSKAKQLESEPGSSDLVLPVFTNSISFHNM